MHDGFVTTGGDRFCKEGLARPSRDAPKQQGGVLRGSECVYVRYVAGTCDHIKKEFSFLMIIIRKIRRKYYAKHAKHANLAPIQRQLRLTANANSGVSTSNTNSDSQPPCTSGPQPTGAYVGFRSNCGIRVFVRWMSVARPTRRPASWSQPTSPDPTSPHLTHPTPPHPIHRLAANTYAMPSNKILT